MHDQSGELACGAAFGQYAVPRGTGERQGLLTGCGDTVGGPGWLFHLLMCCLEAFTHVISNV